MSDDEKTDAAKRYLDQCGLPHDLLNHPRAPVPDLSSMSGSEMIAAERERQVTAEGWTAEHDDEHGGDFPALGRAAVAYIQGATEPVVGYSWWPWHKRFWKPTTPIRMLVKAGALIAAEIDRRLRAGETP